MRCIMFKEADFKIEEFIKDCMNRFGNIVLRCAFSIVGNRADAEDVFSDVFFILWKKNKVFDNQEHLKAWLIRVAINRAKNVKKAAFNRHRVQLHEGIAAKEQDVFIKLALEELPPKDRALVYLHYYEGHSFKDISRMLNVKESSIRSRAMRARERLRDMLEE